MTRIRAVDGNDNILTLERLIKYEIAPIVVIGVLLRVQVRLSFYQEKLELKKFSECAVETRTKQPEELTQVDLCISLTRTAVAETSPAKFSDRKHIRDYSANQMPSLRNSI